MKKKVFIFIVISILILLLLVCLILKNVFLFQGFYKNNNSLSEETNCNIKSLLLDVVKDRHSKLSSMNKNELYTEEVIQNIQEDESLTEKSFWVSIDYNFMGSIKAINENEYIAKVQMKSPNDWCYYFTIKVINGQYMISNFEIDP